MLREFKEFISRGNVIDLAVAVVIGAAFGKIISSLVEGVIMPPIGLLLGKADFSNLFIDLSGQHPVSLADAQLRGLPVIAYGQFINDIVTFLIIALVIFLIVKAVNRLRRATSPQLEGLPVLSPRFRWQRRVAQLLFDELGNCVIEVMSDMLQLVGLVST
jgi:large conductance mechanosensitive channel